MIFVVGSHLFCQWPSSDTASQRPTMAYVPIIDFRPFHDPFSSDEVKKNIALEINRACREVGFFYLSNHGVYEELRVAMLSRARTFFESATEEEKKAISIKPAGTDRGDDARGFQKVDGRGKGAHEVRALIL